MIHLQNVKRVVMIAQVAATNGATITSQQVDTKGYRYCSIEVQCTTSNNATNKPATFRVTESDDTVLTNYAAVAALTGGTAAGNFTIPSMETASSTNVYAVLNIDLRPRKRYLTVEISPVTTQTFVAIATLSRAEIAPDTIANEGTLVRVNA